MIQRFTFLKKENSLYTFINFFLEFYKTIKPGEFLKFELINKHLREDCYLIVLSLKKLDRARDVLRCDKFFGGKDHLQ